jgi:ClpP class serine protease
MNTTTASRLSGLGRFIKWLLWTGVAVVLLQEACAPYQLAAARDNLINQLQDQRKSRVMAMIHRQENVSLFGVPVSSFIDIEDSEAVLRGIRSTPADEPIDFILHTPGGLVLAAEQIAHALVEHKGKVTVFVPHYAMSGGTLLALAADQIIMDPNAVLGPVDPQIDDMPAASIVAAVTLKRPAQVSDEMLVRADVAAKARNQVASFVTQVLLKHLPPDKASALALTLSDGRWTHDFPITVEAARQLGLPVSVDMPPLIYQLMDLYPQDGTNRPSVLYVPMRPRPTAVEGQGSPSSAPESSH